MARYRIDPGRSHVQIDARSNVHPINTRSDGLVGFVDLEVQGGGRVDLTVPPAGELSFPVENLRSGNRLEDRELQKRINARRFPTIRGVLTTMTRYDRREENGADNKFRVQGDLEFRGVTKAIEDDLTVDLVDGDAGTIRLRGASTFDIRDFGMEPPRIFVLRVEPAVNVSVDIVAQRVDGDDAEEE